MEYRDRLFGAQASTHLERYRPVTPATLERDRRLFVALYRRLLPANRDAAILEVGCGSGSFLHFCVDFTHEATFTPLSIRQVPRATGFDDIVVVPLEPCVHGPASATRWLLWKGIKQFIRLYLLIEQGTPGSGVFTANLCATARKAVA